MALSLDGCALRDALATAPAFNALSLVGVLLLTLALALAKVHLGAGPELALGLG
jgi:hypothetical protein